MKKVINQPENVVSEMIDGYIAAYGGNFEKIEGVTGIVKRNLQEKVGIVFGGGSGHEPLFIGFAGEGLADGIALGNVFAAPTPKTILEVTKAVHKGKGVLYLYGNYSGDVLNFDMAAELAEYEDIDVKTILVTDDVASAPPERKYDRRGIAGDVLVLKIAGAASEKGMTLEEVAVTAQKANDSMASIGIALSPGSIPGTDKYTFSLGENEIEFGMGIHGEQGIRRDVVKPADQMVEEMMEYIFEEMVFNKEDEVVVLVNGLGSTTILELLIVNRKVKQILTEKNIIVHDMDVNNYCTTQEMAGFSITVFKLNEQLKELYDMPAKSPYYIK